MEDEEPDPLMVAALAMLNREREPLEPVAINLTPEQMAFNLPEVAAPSVTVDTSQFAAALERRDDRAEEMHAELLNAFQSVADSLNKPPVPMRRRIERDANSNLVAVIDEPLEEVS
jgi:hypothetical protein